MTITQGKALEALIAAVEAGTARYADFATTFAGYTILDNLTCAYNGSLDAAAALHGALLPGWQFAGGGDGASHEWHVGGEGKKAARGDGPTLARAWLLAILRALAATTPPGAAG